MLHSFRLHTILFLILLFSLFCSLLFFAFQQVHASQIPIGLNSKHGIFVQEFWQGNSPTLCLTNRSEKNKTVRVSRWPARQLPADLLMRWPLQAGSAQCHSVSGLEGQQLLEFTLANGLRLGLFKIQRAGLIEEKQPEEDVPQVGLLQEKPASVFSSFKGPNGTCSTSDNTWIEQSNLWLKAGEPAYVTLLSAGTNTLIEMPIETRLDLPLLPIKSMSSDTLVIDNDGNQFTIKKGALAAERAIHQTRLEFDVPAVMQPTMFVISGRQRIANNGWQCFIRGVMVEP